jgi:hypothetical protein
MNYTTLFNSSEYYERFTTTAITAGIKLGRFSLDYAILNTQYKFYPTPTKISILSSALQFKRVLFNLALRNEVSNSPSIDQGQIIMGHGKNDLYYGVQFIPFKKLTLGVAYNQFLMDEYSFTCTLFF